MKANLSKFGRWFDEKGCLIGMAISLVLVFVALFILFGGFFFRTVLIIPNIWFVWFSFLFILSSVFILLICAIIQIIIDIKEEGD